MRVVVYNERGYPIETLESTLVPKPDREGVYYLEYESFNVKVITKVERIPPQREREKIVAVKNNGKILVFEELPEKLAEKLGVEKVAKVRKIRV